MKTRASLAAALISMLLVGCETPRHSNTLIFGTSTKVAIDASQEPSGALGLTLGYKRNEAVWMPLIANEANAENKLVPQKCAVGNADCLKFQGETGTGGGAASTGAKDTYSVLATFSGNVATTAQNPQAKGAVAQYFATGIAARLLAEKGGAALVNTAAPPAAESAAAVAAAQGITKKADAVVIKVSKTTGEINAQTLTTLLGKAPASEIDETNMGLIKQQKTAADLTAFLRDAPPVIVDKLYQTLDKL